MRLLIVFLLASILLIGCNRDLEVNDNDVESELDAISLNKNHYEIDLNDLTDFSWEKAYLFSPYTPKEHMTEKLGFHWRNSIGLDYRDDIQLIVFVEDEKVIKYMELSRKYGDFASEDLENAITPDHAKVMLEKLP